MNIFLRCGVLALVCVTALSGCSNFRGSTRLDMGPFAENTTAMLTEAQAILKPLPWGHLREYQVEVRHDEAVQNDIDAVRRIFAGIGMYSLQVVSLNASRLSEKECTEKLADYFSEVLQPIFDLGVEKEFNLTRSGVDSTLANIRNSATFMGAIGAADPMVYSIVQFAIQRVDRVAEVAMPGFEIILMEVETSYLPTREEIARLDSCEAADVRTYLALQDYRMGKVSRDAVIALDPLLAHVLTDKDEVRAYERAQDILRARLAATDSTRAQLAVKTAEYRAKVAEATDLEVELERRVRAARSMLVYWLRAHRNLAQGVEVPPAINIGQMMGSSAKKAVGAVIP